MSIHFVALFETWFSLQLYLRTYHSFQFISRTTEIKKKKKQTKQISQQKKNKLFIVICVCARSRFETKLKTIGWSH